MNRARSHLCALCGLCGKRNLVVILITGFASPELIVRAQRAGVDYYLLKPLGLGQLDEIVRTALQPASVVDATAIAELVQRAYAAAGRPYGNTAHGLLRWAKKQFKL